MPPKRSSSRPQQPAQRRPRIGKACNFCRIAKHRCEPTEYGTNDRACRRCVSQRLDCDLPRVARSQSPSSGLGAQGSGPIQHPIASHSAGGTTEALTQGSETNIQYTLPESESVQVPMRRWSPLMMHSEERQGSSTTTTLTPGQTPLQTPSFLPAVPGMESCQGSFPNIAQGSDNPESGYYQGYYGPATPDNTYMAGYATQSASDGGPNLGYTLENQPDDGGASVNEQDDPAGEF